MKRISTEAKFFGWLLLALIVLLFAAFSGVKAFGQVTTGSGKQPTVESFGARGGVNDDTAAFQSALNAAMAVQVGTNTYTVGNLFPTNGSRLIGSGATLVFKSTATSNMFTIATNVTNFVMSGVNLDGRQVGFVNGRAYGFNGANEITFSSTITRSGIRMSPTSTNCEISNVRISSFSDAGIVWDGGNSGTPIPTYLSGTFRGIKAYDCWDGFRTTNNAEYIQLEGIEAAHCGHGIAIYAGNTYVTAGAKFTGGGVGVYVYPGNNGAHGRIVGADLNHNEKAADLNGFNNDFVLQNCGVLGQGTLGGNNGIYITNATGVNLQGCTIANPIIVDGTGGTAGNNFLTDCRFLGQPIITKVNGGILIVKDNVNEQGSATVTTTNDYTTIFTAVQTLPSLVVTGSGGIAMATNSTAPGNTTTIRVWVTVTNTTGGVFKMPLYQ